MIPRLGIRWLTPLVLGLVLAHVAAAQGEEDRAQTEELQAEFARLVAEGEREQIPWKISFSEPRLRLNQRLGATLVVTLSHSELNRHAEKHDLLLMVRLGRHGDADWLPGLAWVPQQLTQPLANRTDIEFQVFFLAKPGDLRVGVVLVDRLSGHSSVAVRTVRIPPLSSDPLPNSFHDLPAAEFAPVQDFKGAFLPDMQSKLRLPVQLQAQIEVLVNFSHSEEFRTSPGVRVGRSRFPWFAPRRKAPSGEDNVYAVLSALKPLTELAAPEGVQITALDVLRRRVVYEKPAGAPLDWPQLRDGLAEFRSSVISADALLGQKEGAEFFRQHLRRRIEAAGNMTETAGSSAAPEEPLRVFIVLSSAMLFPDDTNLSPIEPAPSCNCRFYFIRLRVFGNYWDDLHRVLGPLAPRRFDVRSAEDYRRALAAILKDLSKP